MCTSHLAKQLAIKIHLAQSEKHTAHILVCTGRTQRTKQLLAQSENHTAYNFKIYRHIQFAHSEGKNWLEHCKRHTAYNFKNIPACTVRTQRRKKLTRTQREAHSLQFEKIYLHVQFAQGEGKIYSHTARSTQLTIWKNIPACTVHTQRRKNLLAHSEKHTAYNFKNIPAYTVRTQRRKKLTRTQREAHSLQFEKIYLHVQFAHGEGKIYSHTARSTQLTIWKNIPACTVRTQRRKNLLAHNEKHTAYNLKKYTCMYSSHTAKEKLNRTQREAHSLQFEKNIYRHVQFAHSEGKNLLAYSEKHTAYKFKKYTGMYSSHTAKGRFTRTLREAHSLQFEKNIPACIVRTQRRKNLLAHSEKHTTYDLKKCTRKPLEIAKLY